MQTMEEFRRNERIRVLMSGGKKSLPVEKQSKDNIKTRPQDIQVEHVAILKEQRTKYWKDLSEKYS